jgi:hypothetical protein
MTNHILEMFQYPTNAIASEMHKIAHSDLVNRQRVFLKFLDLKERGLRLDASLGNDLLALLPCGFFYLGMNLRRLLISASFPKAHENSGSIRK